MAAKVNEELQYNAIPIQTEIVSRREERITALGSNLNGNEVEFLINNRTPNSLIDCSKVEVCMTASINKVAGDKSKIASTVNNVAVINNIHHSIWSNVNVLLNEKVITHNDGFYPYKSYLNKVFKYTQPHVDTHGRRSGFMLDDPDDMDSTTSTRSVPKVTRAIAGGDECITALEVDQTDLNKRMDPFFTGDDLDTPKLRHFTDSMDVILFQGDNVILPPNVDVKINFQRGNTNFYFMNGGAEVYEVKIERMWIKVVYVNVIQSVYERLVNSMSANGVTIPVKRMSIVTKTIPVGLKHVEVNNIITGNKMPDKMYLGMLDNGVTKGIKDKNPFNFKNFDLSEYIIRAAGKQYPEYRMDIDFANDQYMEPFDTFHKVMESDKDGLGSLINYDMYKSGYCFFGADLTSDINTDTNVKQVMSVGDLNIELFFTKDTVAITLMIVCLYNDTIIIEPNTSVRISW